MTNARPGEGTAGKASDSLDAFARLGLERRVDLEAEAIEGAWRVAGREAHPDGGGNTADAAAINRAHDLLRSPSRRIRHWLELRGESASGEDGKGGAVAGRGAPSGDIAEAFLSVGETLQQGEALLGRLENARSAMGRALLSSETLALQSRTQALLAELGAHRANCEASLSAAQADAEGGDASRLEGLGRDLGFLEKWEAQLQQQLLSLMQSLA